VFLVWDPLIYPLFLGHHVVSLLPPSNTAMVFWDIQTGGVAKDIKRSGANRPSPVWLLDGKVIGTMSWDWSARNWVVYLHNIVLGTTQSPGVLQSMKEPYLWAHDQSLWAMAMTQDSEACTLDIFEVGHALTKVKSFAIQLKGHNSSIEAFSPTMYHISISHYGSGDRLLIVDIQNSEVLLDKGQQCFAHCFSSNGSLFAASSPLDVHIWKYDSGSYTPWREFPLLANPDPSSYSQFSPTSSSILGHFQDILWLWHFDGPSIAPTTYEE
jgi:hypothetical protein